MNIEPTSPTAPLASSPPSGNATLWPVGAILTARRTGRDAGGRVALRVADEEVMAEAPPGALLPDTFRVRVGRGGIHPELELVQEGDGVDSHSSRDESLERGRALLSLIPRQSGLAFLMSELGAWLTAPPSEVPDPLRPALASIEASLPLPGAFADAASTRRTLHNAGLLLESRLAHAAAHPGERAALHDWKATLVRLAGTLARQPHIPAATDPDSAIPPPVAREDLPSQPRPRLGPERGPSSEAAQGRLLRAAEGVIARIQIAQLCAQQDDPSWLFELPVRGRDGFDVLQIRLFRDALDGVDAPVWTALVATDFPALGAIGCELRVRSDRVGIGLWAELSAVASRLEAVLPALAEQLHRDGLAIEHLTCRSGRPNRSLAGCGRLFSSVA